MRFYTFTQNNSGGIYRPPATFVIVEAKNVEGACEVAWKLGCQPDPEYDCVECCGPRWDYNNLYPDDEPTILRTPLNLKTVSKFFPDWRLYDARGAGIPAVLIAYADGSVTEIW